jgi:hypothetical protein
MADRIFTDHALQEAYQALMRRSGGAGHVDEATWEAIAVETIEPDARDLAFDHVLQCESCSQVWRGILALRSEAETQHLIAPAAPAAAPSWRSRYVPLAVAATLVIAVAGVMLSRQPAPPIDTVRSAATVAAIDGLMMAYDPAEVPTFVWPPFTGAASYRIEVFTDDGRPMWSHAVAAPPVRWPAETARAVGIYRWRVEALDSSGAPIARSKLTAAAIDK